MGADPALVAAKRRRRWRMVFAAAFVMAVAVRFWNGDRPCAPYPDPPSGIPYDILGGDRRK